MIDIQLPDGRTITIDSDDPVAAAAAGKKVWKTSQAEKGLNAEVAPPIMGDGGREVPWWEQSAPQAPQEGLTVGGDAGRGLQIGSQGAGRGLAELAGAPVDIVAASMNMLPAGAELAANAFLPEGSQIDLPRITNPVGGSQHIRDMAGSASESAGMDLIEESEMAPSERLAYNVNRLGAESVATGGLAAPFAQTSKVAGALAPKTAGALAVDTGAGVGGGAGMTAAEELYPDNPIANLLGTLLGAFSGGRAVQSATAPVAAAHSAERMLPDSSIPADPSSKVLPSDPGGSTSRGTADRAAGILQERATDPTQAAETIRSKVADSAANQEPAPTAGIASDDIGLTAIERGARLKDPVPFQERDQKLLDTAQERVTGLRDPEADPRDAQRAVEVDAAGRRQEAQEPVDEARSELETLRSENARLTAEMEAARADRLKSQDQGIAEQKTSAEAAQEAEKAVGGEVQSRRGDEVAASERLDKAIVDDTLRPMQRQQREKYAAIDPDKSVERSAEPLLDAVTRVRENVPKGVPKGEVLPEKWLREIEALADPETGAPGTISFKDLNDMRPYLSKAITSASRRGDVAQADALRTIKRVLDDEATSVAAEGGEAGVRAQEAVRFTKEEFGPRFGQGEGGRLRSDLNADDAARSATPPTATARRFLKPGPGGKEVAADLRRIREGSGSADEIDQASRDYVLADMAKVVGNDGKINPNRLRTWIKNREGMFQAMPELKAEADSMLRDVVNKREATTKLQSDLETSIAERKGAAVTLQKEINKVRANSKFSEKEKATKIAALERQAAQVERDIQKSATSLLLDTDPKKAASKVFKSNDPETAMAEIVGKLKGDKEAAAGWKRAIVDHMVEKVTNTNTALTGTSDGPVSLAKMQRFFKDNAKALTKVFSPKEMQDLRRAHKMLEPLGNLSRQAVIGSATKENEQIFKAMDAGLLAVTGNAITVGMIMKRIRTVLGLMPGERRAAELVQRAMFDPELAALLLEREVKTIKSPAYNKKLTRLLAVDQAAIESLDEDESRRP